MTWRQQATAGIVVLAAWWGLAGCSAPPATSDPASTVAATESAPAVALDPAAVTPVDNPTKVLADVAGPDLPVLRVTSAPPLDGRHEGPWLAAPRVPQFFRIDPQRGPRPPVHDTDMRLLADDQHLYLSAAMSDADLRQPEKLVDVADRVLRHGGDVFEVFLWPRHLQPRVYFEMHVYPDGTAWQAVHVGRKENAQPWSGAVRSVSRLTAPTEGQPGVWVVQMAIPWNDLSSPGSTAGGQPDWRLQVTRIDVDGGVAPADAEVIVHSATSPLTILWFHMIEQYSRLAFVEAAAPR